MKKIQAVTFYVILAITTIVTFALFSIFIVGICLEKEQFTAVGSIWSILAVVWQWLLHVAFPNNPINIFGKRKLCVSCSASKMR